MKFTDIKLIEPIQKALLKTGYVIATPIQQKAIPNILEGKDIFGIAQTGTGKTAAFTLPILQLMYNKNQELKINGHHLTSKMINKKSNNPKTLILAPTRELAAQIGESISEYGSFTGFRHTVIFGGVKQFSQEKELSRGVDIIIATPGRLLDLMNQRLINLEEIDYFILDEADRMLDMGFINDIKKIIKKIPLKRQTLLFSATMSKEITALANQFLTKAIRVEVSPQATTIDKVVQGVYFVDTRDKEQLLLKLIKSDTIKSVLVFTRTKHKSNKIVEYLRNRDINAQAIHGNKSQSHRVKTLNDFKSGKIKVLVATEIVARGIDIDNISLVINYELPNEPESYVHRIGRTARAGATGIAYSLCDAREREYLREIEKTIKMKIPVIMHDRHSDFAQNAVGAAAKPEPKGKNRSGSKNGGDKKMKRNNNFRHRTKKIRRN